MKKPTVKALPAAAFVLCLGALFALGLRPFLVSAYVGSGYLHGISSQIFQKTEEVFNESLPTKNLFIDVNSFVDRVTGKRSDGRYVKQDSGRLTYVIEKTDTTPFSDAIVSLNDYMSGTLKKPFRFVMFPSSVDPRDKQLPPGVEDYANENADEFLTKIKADGVPVYDLRPFVQSQPDYYSQFYRTDHHWKAETAFSVAQELFRELAAQDASFAVDKTVTDEQNYTTETRDNFLGSLGRHFGRFYCGFESFRAIRPTFSLDLDIYDIAGEKILQGDVENTVLFPEKLTYKNPYLCDMYGYYMGGDPAYRRFVNHSTGWKVVPKKILIIKDSYANALLPYFIYGFQEVTVLDLRSLEGVSTADVIRQEQPDLTLVAYSAVMIRESSNGLFHFFS